MEENTYGRYIVRELVSRVEVPRTGLRRLLAQVRRLAAPSLSIAVWLVQLRLVGLMVSAAYHLETRSRVPFLFLVVYLITLVGKFAEDGWRFLCLNPFRRSRLRLVGDNAPRVDVLITTCGEDLDIICDTVSAACALDYPSSRFRVLVSDDGASPTLRAAITRIARSSPAQLLYFARVPDAVGEKKGAKSGNMNAALAHLDALDEAAEFVAIGDADMILEPDFLRACVPHLIVNSKAAIVVVPQFFYNIPRNDPLNQSLNTQGRSDGAQRDSIQCAWNTGPGAIFRRQALNDIGGFPEYALCEDVMTGWLMNGQGWSNIHVPEELQWGLQPDTLAGHVAQRCKWSVGMIRNAKTAGFGFNTQLLPKMTWRQRVICFTHCASPYFVVWKFARFWLMLAMVLSGQPLIAPANSRELREMVMLSWISVLLARVEDILGGIGSGFAAMRRRKQCIWWMMPYQVSAIVQELLPDRYGGRRLGFVPTAISESAVRERDATRRPGALQRLGIMLLQQGLLYHAVAIAAAYSILIFGTYWTMKEKSYEIDWSILLTHVLVPGSDWENIFYLFTPLVYALWPPTMPPRRKLMQFTELKTAGDGLWRPKSSSKTEKWDTSMLVHEYPHLYVFLLWTYALFWAKL